MSFDLFCFALAAADGRFPHYTRFPQHNCTSPIHAQCPTNHRTFAGEKWPPFHCFRLCRSVHTQICCGCYMRVMCSHHTHTQRPRACKFSTVFPLGLFSVPPNRTHLFTNDTKLDYAGLCVRVCMCARG